MFKLEDLVIQLVTREPTAYEVDKEGKRKTTRKNGSWHNTNEKKQAKIARELKGEK